MFKHESALETHVADSDASLDGFNGTSEDAKDMDRLGRAQELKVCATCTQWPWRMLTFDRETSALSRSWA